MEHYPATDRTLSGANGDATRGADGQVTELVDGLPLPRLFAICLDDEEEPLGPDELPAPGEVVALGIWQEDEVMAYRYDPRSGHRTYIVYSSTDRVLRSFRHVGTALRLVWL